MLFAVQYIRFVANKEALLFFDRVSIRGKWVDISPQSTGNKRKRIIGMLCENSSLLFQAGCPVMFSEFISKSFLHITDDNDLPSETDIK